MIYVVSAIDSQGFIKAKWLVNIVVPDTVGVPNWTLAAETACDVIKIESRSDDGPKIPENTSLSAIPFDICSGEYVPVWLEGCQHTVQFG